MKLNLGCGSDILGGYVNVDVRRLPGVDIVCDITKKLPFKDNSVIEIKAYDVIEHMIISDQENFLKELSRILKKNGKVIIRTPNIDRIWEQFADDPETRNLFLYGDTEKQGIWGAHKTGHTLLSLATMFRVNGFKIEKHDELDTNFIIELRKVKLVINPKLVKKILIINKPVVKNYWFYKIRSYFYEEFSVPDLEVYNSLFPKTGLPITRVLINSFDYQLKRISARQLASLDLMI